MTWFQLLESRREEATPRQPERLAPNSALFLNPALPLRVAPEPEAAAPRRHLRLVKGSRVGPSGIPSAA